MSQAQSVKITIQSSLSQVMLVSVAVKAICQALTFPEDFAEDVELCVGEAVNNVIEHAYQGVSGNQIEVELQSDVNQLEIRILDSGKEAHYPKTIATPQETDNIQELPEAGMGLFIMHSIMDELSYEFVDGKNVLRMLKTLPK